MRDRNKIHSKNRKERKTARKNYTSGYDPSANFNADHHEYTYKVVKWHRDEVLQLQRFLSSEHFPENYGSYRSRSIAFRMYFFHKRGWRNWLRLLRKDRIQANTGGFDCFYVPLPDDPAPAPAKAETYEERIYSLIQKNTK